MANPPLDELQIKRIVEAALLASDGPLSVANITRLFVPGELDPDNASKQVRDALKALQAEAEERGVELRRIASGYRYQVRQELSEWVSRLWDEKPPRYTRALLETLSIIIYKQPVTRGDIEQIRGVGVSQNIMRTLVERDWIKVVGQKEVPGRPSLYGTTKALLDYFSLKSLDELPPLAEIKALIEPKLVDETGQMEGLETAPDVPSGAADDPAAQDIPVDDTAGSSDGIEVGSVTVDSPDTTGTEEADAQDSTTPSAEVVPLHGSKSAS